MIASTRRVPARTLISWLKLLAVAAMVALGLCVFLFWIQHYRALRATPSLIDQLRSREVSIDDIDRVDVVQYDPGGSGVSWADRVFITVRDRDAIALCAAGLASSRSGTSQRNHPVSVYYGVARILLKDESCYYVFYQLGYYQERYFAWLDAGPANPEDPYITKPYESRVFVDFLREHDPWFQDMDTPASPERPSSPDTVP